MKSAIDEKVTLNRDPVPILLIEAGPIGNRSRDEGATSILGP
jgi:hypothetical protein